MRVLYSVSLSVLLLLTIISSCKKKDVQPTPTPITIFHDDFVDDRYNWPQKQTDTVSLTINNGYYNITNFNIYPSYGVWNGIVIDQSKSFSIKASIIFTSGATDYGYGIDWGKKDSINHFTFLIAPNGYFTIFKNVNGTITNIKDWTVCFYINGIRYSNLLEVRNDGGNYIFYINNQQVYTTSYQAFLGNDTGFGVYDSSMAVSVDYLDISQW